jgi:hypothetical protein
LFTGLFLSQGLAQRVPGKASPGASAPTKRFCQANAGFCVSYPANWLVLGEAFGNGTIIAPEQKTERALWDEVTVATVVPVPGENQTAPSIEDLINTAMNTMQAEGRNPQTLERQQRTVADLPAQMIRIRYNDDDGRNWIEELVFIEGPEQEIYSVALKAQPANVSHLEPAFASILRSWKLQAQPVTPAPDNSAASSGATPSPPRK